MEKVLSGEMPTLIVGLMQFLLEEEIEDINGIPQGTSGIQRCSSEADLLQPWYTERTAVKEQFERHCTQRLPTK